MKKQKKLNRKLTLNKKTIASLTPKRMDKVAGGKVIPCNTSEVDPTFFGKSCPGYYTCPCPTILDPTCVC